MTRDVSIDEIIDYLEETGVLLSQKQDRPGNAGADKDDIKDAQRLLVFALLGWQSMVYLPELNSHPTHTLAIQHDTEWPDSGLVFDRYTIASSADMSDRPLWVLLKCFGNLLPAHPSDLAVNAADVAAIETSKAAASWAALYPDQLNAYLLSTLMRVKFRWVDTLALHMDYDKSTRTLSLFSFPSICVAHLQARAIVNMDNNDGASAAKPPAGGAIFAFSSLEVYAADPRADEDDIAHFLQEVLVSFRLLFGQSAKSRKVFREGAKPTSIRDLINDRRDTLQFWTFWFISVFGGIGIFMGIIQIILQVIQIAQAAGKI
ncbi:hypothetical protein SEUCBS140593_001530 [Sporothrix eucalyptigena]|uniref:Uncharacterized protein n=1 Tax=Sporothrix eucalyptigena TaxID=1812306 RepID=A0ABP0AYY8_9PEZI